MRCHWTLQQLRFPESTGQRPYFSLSADRDVRVQNLENWKKISKRKAERLLADTDNNRKEFHKYYTNQIWGQAEYYDLCLNISSLGVEGTARVIEAYIAEKHLEK